MDVFGLYFVYHCMIRAKVAAIRSTERDEEQDRQEDIDALKHNLAVAARWIDATPPTIVAMHGYSGSGKTWMSSQLMSQLPAIRVRSDIERKRLVGLDETASSNLQPGQGMYGDRARADVYQRLIEMARRLLEAGFNVIVDASFLRQSDRQLFAALAERLDVSFVFVDTNADNAELERRLKKRTIAGKNASDANIDVLRYQYDHSDPLTVAERKKTVFVATDSALDTGHVIKSLRRM
jgi:predicted kinase